MLAVQGWRPADHACLPGATTRCPVERRSDLTVVGGSAAAIRPGRIADVVVDGPRFHGILLGILKVRRAWPSAVPDHVAGVCVTLPPSVTLMASSRHSQATLSPSSHGTGLKPASVASSCSHSIAGRLILVLLITMDLAVGYLVDFVVRFLLTIVFDLRVVDVIRSLPAFSVRENGLAPSNAIRVSLRHTLSWLS